MDDEAQALLWTRNPPFLSPLGKFCVVKDSGAWRTRVGNRPGASSCRGRGGDRQAWEGLLRWHGSRHGDLLRRQRRCGRVAASHECSLSKLWVNVVVKRVDLAGEWKIEVDGSSSAFDRTSKTKCSHVVPRYVMRACSGTMIMDAVVAFNAVAPVTRSRCFQWHEHG